MGMGPFGIFGMFFGFNIYYFRYCLVCMLYCPLL